MARQTVVRSGPLTFGLVVLLAASVATYLRSAPPDPLSADAPPEAFSASRALAVLETLVGDGTPHPIGTTANARVRDRIVEAFSALGYATEIQTTFACSGLDFACGTVNNIIARRHADSSGRHVLLVSHYDSVAAGPGASDAGISVAAMVESARALASDANHRNPVVFLVTDGEEAGLLGASGFVREHPLARQIGAVVNLEARGTSGPSVMFETSGDNAWLVDLLASSLERPIASSLFYPVYERLPNDTDLSVFKQAGIPGVNFAFIGNVARYHSPFDDVAHASAETVQHHGQNALAIVRALADADFDARPDGNSVFFDVLGTAIVRWPIGWTLPLAAMAMVLVALATLISWRFKDSSIGRTLVGLIAWVLAVGLTALAAWRLVGWMTDEGAWPGGATTQPQFTVVAFWLVGASVALLTAAALGRWTGAAGTWTGSWLGWSAAALGAALYFPEASYVLLAPALVAGLSGLVVMTVFQRPPGAFALALPLLTAALLLMPPAWMLFDALGPSVLPVVASVIAIVATVLSPLVVRGGGVRWLFPVVLSGLAGAFGWAALEAPAFSADAPERLNLVYFQQADEPQARWIASPQSGVLPESMRQAAPFGIERAAGFPWSRANTAYVAELPASTLNEPVVDVVSRETRNGHVVIRLRALSPRKAPVLSLLLPPGRIVSVTMNDVPIPGRPADAAMRMSQRDTGQRLRNYTCFTVPADGVRIELVVDGPEAVEGFLLDLSPGLPGEAAPLLAARPPQAAPNGQGDVTILARSVTF